MRYNISLPIPQARPPVRGFELGSFAPLPRTEPLRYRALVKISSFKIKNKNENENENKNKNKYKNKFSLLMVAKLVVYVKGLNYFLTLLPPFPSTHPFVRKISILVNFLCFFSF
jgi:hypothetical protein